jgi:predicted dehydrogenase
MLKIGIVGCGKIADIHAAEIVKVGCCSLVAVCDSEILMARQLADRFAVPMAFDKMSNLLEAAKPDVVHITTPPQSHFLLAKLCLESGCHVYVEKPFCVNTSEAEQLIEVAERKGLRITVGHDDQFTHVAREMRNLIRQGYLGGPPVHMESYYGYDLSEKNYAQSLVADRQHWVRGLPGGLAQNVISHGVCRIAEFLESDCPSVQAYGFASPTLIELGEKEIVDELRVIISDGETTTAYFTFSSQMRPSLRHFRVYGRKNGIVIDHDQQILIRLRGARFRSHLERFVPPITFSVQYAGNALTNVWRFIRSDFHMKAGMNFLISAFYDSILQDLPLPIGYREILRTSRIMDQIFSQVQGLRAEGEGTATFIPIGQKKELD